MSISTNNKSTLLLLCVRAQYKSSRTIDCTPTNWDNFGWILNSIVYRCYQYTQKNISMSLKVLTITTSVNKNTKHLDETKFRYLQKLCFLPNEKFYECVKQWNVAVCSLMVNSNRKKSRTKVIQPTRITGDVEIIVRFVSLPKCNVHHSDHIHRNKKTSMVSMYGQGCCSTFLCIYKWHLWIALLFSVWNLKGGNKN